MPRVTASNPARPWRRVVVFVLVLVVAGLVGLEAAPNQPVYDYRPGTEAAGAGPARPLGSRAPDLALPTLESYLPGAKTVELKRLSAYRGKRPVVLIATGYT
ncbi:MAG: hypothetical protein ACYDCO_23780 [Armatimonadota bacterium]